MCLNNSGIISAEHGGERYSSNLRNLFLLLSTRTVGKGDSGSFKGLSNLPQTDTNERPLRVRNFTSRFSVRPDAAVEGMVNPFPRAPAILWADRSKPIYCVAAALVLAGLYLALLAPKVFEAKALIQLDLTPNEAYEQIEQRSGIEGRKIEVETQLAIIISQPVLEAAVQNLKEAQRQPSISASALKEVLKPDLLPGTLVIALKSRASDPTQSALIANAVAHEYLNHQTAKKANEREKAIRALRSRVSEQAKDIARAEAQRAKFANANDTVTDTHLRELQSELKKLQLRKERLSNQAVSEERDKKLNSVSEAEIVLRQRVVRYSENRSGLSDLDTHIATLITARTTTHAQLKSLASMAGTDRPDARIISRAEPPGRAIAPRRGLVFSMFGLIGVLTGCIWALISGRHRGGLRDSHQLERVTGLPTLATLPDPEPPYSISILQTRKAEFNSKCADIASDLWQARKTPRFLAITASYPNEGQNQVALGLALALSDRGRVLVIDADMHRPTLGKEFGSLPPPYGLAAVLTGLASLTEVLVRSEDTPIDVIPGEASEGDPLTLLSSSEFEAFLTKARADYRHVIMVLPPLLACDDAQTLMQHCDASLFCARWDRTKAADIRKSVEILASGQKPPFGALLTRRISDPDTKVTGYVRWPHTKVERGGALENSPI